MGKIKLQVMKLDQPIVFNFRTNISSGEIHVVGWLKCGLVTTLRQIYSVASTHPEFNLLSQTLLQSMMTSNTVP
ncbi:hypothetical protein P8452_71852 [Trifolium repens]|nr:hypothetical protein P8452_61466 [Trifolium repens]WJX89892.1 hypothetical protein P8452_71852 [Trifolium repens]